MNSKVLTGRDWIMASFIMLGKERGDRTRKLLCSPTPIQTFNQQSSLTSGGLLYTWHKQIVSYIHFNNSELGQSLQSLYADWVTKRASFSACLISFCPAINPHK